MEKKSYIKYIILISVSVLLIAALIFYIAFYNPFSKNDKTVQPSKTSSLTGIDEIVKAYKLNDKFVIPEAQAHTYTDKENHLTLPYRMYLPENYNSSKKYPVLLFLHGLGENGTDNKKQLNNFEQAFTVAGDILSKAIIICPQSQYGWRLHGESGDLAAVKKLLDSIIKKYNGDKNRIYITGLSMGGYGTWRMLEEYGSYFAAGVPLCGWGNSFAASELANIPIWVFHGTEDPTVNIASSEEMVRAITACGGSMIEFTRLSGVAHNAWDYAYTNREMFCWMFSQNLKTHQSYTYDYFEYFKLTDPDGKKIFTEKDITFASQSFSDGNQYIEVKLTDTAFKNLKKAYNKNKNETFTVYYCSEKLYSFKFVSPPEDGCFYIHQVTSDEEFEKMVINFERINAKI